MAAQEALAWLVALATSTAALADTPYTLADLEKLVAEKAYQEAYTHLGDIAPAQRTGKWLDVAASASVGLIATLPADDAARLVAIVAIDGDYPQLLSHAKYVKARAEHGASGVASCLRATRGSDECVRLATRLVETKSDRKLAFEIGKAVVKHGPAGAVAMFARAVDPKDRAQCRDDDLERAVLAGLAQRQASAIAADARTLMTACWDDVKDGVVKEFDESSKNSAFHKNTCDVLHAKRMLSSLQAKRCGK